jgi:hypothetical protein
MTLRGSDFIRSLPSGGDRPSIEAREEQVIDAVRRGISLPISWVPVKTQIPGHTAVVYVASDTLRFGEGGPNTDPDNWDWVRIAVTADTAQSIADQLGVLMPTDKILDLAHAQADVRLTPHFQDPVTATTGAMLKHHAAIEGERAGRDGLLSTLGKDWILGNELFPPRPGALPPHHFGYDGAINYGWHIDATPEDLAAIAHHQRYPREPYSGPYMGQPGIALWQTKGYRHNRGHVDYSQWVPRFVHPWMEVNAERRRTADVMQSPTLSGLVSYEGPLRGIRYPDRAQDRAAGGSGRHEAPEAGSPSDPFDDLQAKRSPHVCNGCGGPVWWERHDTTRARELAIRCGFCLGIFCLPCSLLHFGAVR